MNSNKKNKLIDTFFYGWGFFSTLIGLILLGLFIGYILSIGLGRINLDFLLRCLPDFLIKQVSIQH